MQTWTLKTKYVSLVSSKEKKLQTENVLVDKLCCNIDPKIDYWCWIQSYLVKLITMGVTQSSKIIYN